MVLKHFILHEKHFKANLFFHLYETHITPLGIPIPTGKIRCFKTMLVFSNGKWGIENPLSQLNGKFH